MPYNSVADWMGSDDSEDDLPICLNHIVETDSLVSTASWVLGQARDRPSSVRPFHGLSRSNAVRYTRNSRPRRTACQRPPVVVSTETLGEGFPASGPDTTFGPESNFFPEPTVPFGLGRVSAPGPAYAPDQPYAPGPAYTPGPAFGSGPAYGPGPKLAPHHGRPVTPPIPQPVHIFSTRPSDPRDLYSYQAVEMNRRLGTALERTDAITAVDTIDKLDESSDVQFHHPGPYDSIKRVQKSYIRDLTSGTKATREVAEIKLFGDTAEDRNLDNRPVIIPIEEHLSKPFMDPMAASYL